MRKFLYFLSADADFLQKRLERLAARGWELSATDGLFTGRFVPTERSDLRWLVVPCGGAKNFPQMEEYEYEFLGWTLVGGFNGMAVFKSLPMSDPDEAELRSRLERDGCIRRDRLTVPLTALAAVAVAAVLWIFPRSGAVPFWQTYPALAFWFLRWAILALAAVNLVSLPRSTFAAWIHGLTLPVGLGAVFLAALTAYLAETAHTGYFILLPLLLAAACLLAFWRRCRPLSIVLAVICLAVLYLGLLFPDADRAEVPGRSLRSSVSDEAVLTLTDVGEQGTLNGAGYTKDGTFLARRTSYWEMSEDASVSSEVYCCLTPGLARAAEAELTALGSWTETDYGRRSADGTTVVICSGRYAAKLSYSGGFDDSSAERAFYALFSSG